MTVLIFDKVVSSSPHAHVQQIGLELTELVLHTPLPDLVVRVILG